MKERQVVQVEFVYFDLGNVLLSFDPSIACRNLARLLSVSADEARQAVYESGLQHRFEQGDVSSDQFADEVCHLFGRGEVAKGDILDAVSDMFQPIASMRRVMESVRAAGMGVGLLSNTCHAHWDWIVRQGYPVTEFTFDATILSFEVGSMKPDSFIYQTAERAAAVKPQAILFLDDREENVGGARDCGWQAEQCFGGPQAEEVLRRAGVLGQKC